MSAPAPILQGPIPHFLFHGVKVNDVSLDGAVRRVAERIRSTGYICLTDVGITAMSFKDPAHRAAINGAFLSLCDGTPLYWFGRMTGYRSVRRIAGVEFMSRMLREPNGYRHFLLGDTEATIANVIQRARAENPGIRISGRSPPFREFTAEDDAEMLGWIREADADLVWVCFGGGKQEKWAALNASRMDHGLMVCVGAAFRFYTGQIRVPPRWVQRAGLQWLHRTLQSPDPVSSMRARWRRYWPFLRCFPFELEREWRTRPCRTENT